MFNTHTRASWRGGAGWAMTPPIFSKSSDFWKFNVSSGKFRTFAVGKDKGFEFYRKIFKLGPLIYRSHDAPAHTLKRTQISL